MSGYIVSPWPASTAPFEPIAASGRPLYRQDNAEYTAFYAPGCLCVVDSAGADTFASTLGLSKRTFPHETQDVKGQERWADELWRCAEGALTYGAGQEAEPFAPECLTLYLNNECHLHCTYCYADPSPLPKARLALVIIAAAAERVAESCRKNGRPFYVVFHGGGEPTLHPDRVDRILETLDAVAHAHDVPSTRYVATNGVLSESRARWLAHRFDRVGLSCDGPPVIQDRQRPLQDGGGSAQFVERTARILREEGCPFHVRATITPHTMHRQAEIANYVCQQLSPQEIHLEPVYLGGRADAAQGFDARQAGEFVGHWVQAQEMARQHGIPLTTSGSRPGSLHGPYCNVFRSVLNLVPGGLATACFKTTSASQALDTGTAIGCLDVHSGRFEIDRRRIQTLRRQLGVLPAACSDCLNRYHCVRGCPDRCPLESGGAQRDNLPESFRCRMLKSLTQTLLGRAAARLWNQETRERGEHNTRVRGTTAF
jgi:sulfatase maturation enzyme AslB (radical SAM superfamily)